MVHKKLLTLEELAEPNGITIILGVEKDDLKTLKEDDVVVYSGKLVVNGEQVTVKLVPNRNFAQSSFHKAQSKTEASA